MRLTGALRSRCSFVHRAKPFRGRMPNSCVHFGIDVNCISRFVAQPGRPDRRYLLGRPRFIWVNYRENHSADIVFEKTAVGAEALIISRAMSRVHAIRPACPPCLHQIHPLVSAGRSPSGGAQLYGPVQTTASAACELTGTSILCPQTAARCR